VGGPRAALPIYRQIGKWKGRKGRVREIPSSKGKEGCSFQCKGNRKKKNKKNELKREGDGNHPSAIPGGERGCSCFRDVPAPCEEKGGRESYRFILVHEGKQEAGAGPIPIFPSEKKRKVFRKKRKRREELWSWRWEKKKTSAVLQAG